MSQNDFTIANQTFPTFRSDLNDALQALASLSSGSSAPSTTYPNMFWYDTGNNTLKMRTEADDAWIDVGYLCQSTNKFCIFDDTNVVNSSGTQVGLIGDQPTSDWEAGTSTTESLVSPEKVKAAIDSNVPPQSGVGINQTWQDVTSSRSKNTVYNNNTGGPIVVSISFETDDFDYGRLFVDGTEVSRAGNNKTDNADITELSAVVPAGSNYEIKQSGRIIVSLWVELR
jgi:hypothetical protein